LLFLNAYDQSLVLLFTVAINVLEPGAFNPESQYFFIHTLCLIKFHDFADNSQEGMKHQTRAETQAQQGMTFTENSIDFEKLLRGENI
jgi:hypothetical protein